jgi:hypothetical protein
MFKEKEGKLVLHCYVMSMSLSLLKNADFICKTVSFL